MKSFKKVLALVLSVVMVLGSMTMAFADTKVITPELTFSDMDVNYETAVAKLKAAGIVDGNPDGTINLGGNLNRAEMAKIVVTMLGLNEGLSLSSPNRTTFTDLYDGFWANDYIYTAVNLGIIVGYTDGRFGINDNVTEEQVVTMVLRALEWDQIVKNTGVYPLPQTAKALELGIVDKAPIYGKAASRGYAFAVAAEALTVPMAKRSATSNNVIYDGEKERTILVDFLKVNEISGVVNKTARMEREYNLNEFQIDRDTFVYTNKDLDATEYLGEVVNVWYEYNKATKENEVIYAEIDSVDSNKVEGTVTEVNVKTNEVTIDGRTYSVVGNEYYKDNKYRTMPAKGDFIKATLNRKSEIVFADAFDLTVADTYDTNKFNLVSKIEKVEVGTRTDFIRFRDQNGDTRTITNEKVIVYKDGKIGDVEDIKDLDLVKELKFDKSKTTLIYAVEASQTGKIENVVFDSKAKKQEDAELTIVLNDEDILVNQENFVITGAKVGEPAKDEGRKEAFNVELAYILRDYVKKDKEKAKEVTVFVMPNGKAALLVTDVEPKTVKSAMVYNLGRKYDTWESTNIAGVNFLTHENKTAEVFFTGLAKAGLELYSFKDIKGEHKENDYVKGFTNLRYNGSKVTVYTKGVPGIKDDKIKDENKPVDVTLGKAGGKEVKSLKNYTLGTAEKYYNITNSTVFYNLNKDQDKYEVVKYDAIKDMKINDVYVHIFVDEDTEKHVTPVADIVVVTSGYFETKDKDLTYGVIETSYRSGDYIVYIIDTGAEESEYFAHKANDKIDNGTAVQFRKTDEKADDIVKIKDLEKGKEERLTNINRGLYTIDGKIYEVAVKAVINTPVYDSNYDYVVSYVTEADKIKALNVLRTIGKTEGITTEGRVTYIGKDGSRVFADVGKATVELVDKAQATFTDSTYGSELLGTSVSFLYNNRGQAYAIKTIELETKTYKPALLNDLVTNHGAIKIAGQGKTKTTVDGAVEIKADNVKINDVKIAGKLTVTGNDFTSKDNHITGDVEVNGKNASFNTEIDGDVTVKAEGAKFANVEVKGDFTVAAAAKKVEISGTTKISGEITLAVGATIDASKATDETVKKKVKEKVDEANKEADVKAVTAAKAKLTNATTTSQPKDTDVVAWAKNLINDVNVTVTATAEKGLVGNRLTGDKSDQVEVTFTLAKGEAKDKQVVTFTIVTDAASKFIVDAFTVAETVYAEETTNVSFTINVQDKNGDLTNSGKVRFVKVNGVTQAVMLTEDKATLEVPVALTFKNAGKQDVVIEVEGLDKVTKQITVLPKKTK